MLRRIQQFAQRVARRAACSRSAAKSPVDSGENGTERQLASVCRLEGSLGSRPSSISHHARHVTKLQPKWAQSLSNRSASLVRVRTRLCVPLERNPKMQQNCTPIGSDSSPTVQFRSFARLRPQLRVPLEQKPKFGTHRRTQQFA